MIETVESLGERKVISIITSHIDSQDLLYKGVGHDAGFLDINIKPDEVLAVNTDRSGLNAALKYGLDDGQCVGDFAISHAVSDIVASGARPVSVAIAMLLPPDTEIPFLDNVMKGIVESANRYGVTITGGDTKKNKEFALVVTACGIAKKKNVLARNTVEAGDLLVVTGNLGSFLLGMYAHKNDIKLTKTEKQVVERALIEQRPPFELGLELSRSGLMNACTDISDGLPAAIYNLCAFSGLGCRVNDADIPVAGELAQLQGQTNLSNVALSSAGGDWEYLYSVSPNNFAQLKALNPKVCESLHIIGVVEKSDDFIVVKKEQEHYLINNENDSFKKSASGKGHFSQILSGESTPLGERIT